MVRLRNTAELSNSPREISSLCKSVVVYHPFEENILFSFPAYALPASVFDAPGPATELDQCVVDYQLVMDACHIVTNGEGSDVHLVRKQDNTRVPADTTALVPGRYSYYLSEASPTTDYEVVTEFAAWQFPQDSLPHRWDVLQRSEAVRKGLHDRFLAVSASEMSTLVKLRDEQCVITKYRASRPS